MSRYHFFLPFPFSSTIEKYSRAETGAFFCIEGVVPRPGWNGIIRTSLSPPRVQRHTGLRLLLSVEIVNNSRAETGAILARVEADSLAHHYLRPVYKDTPAYDSCVRLRLFRHFFPCAGDFLPVPFSYTWTIFSCRLSPPLYDKLSFVFNRSIVGLWLFWLFWLWLRDSRVKINVLLNYIRI